MNRMLAIFVVLGLSACGQSRDSAPAKAAVEAQPATKMEGFRPAAGSVVIFGYDELGRVLGVSVDVREIRDAKGASVRGLLVEVTQDQYRHDRSFVDADEIPELIRGLDALMQVKENPTKFKNFEVRYATKGELQLTAFNTPRGGILYAVKAGRTGASAPALDESGIQKLRAIFQAAADKLASLASK